MSRVKLAITVGLLGAAVSASAVAIAGDGDNAKARLSGFQEVPAVITDGSGMFSARISQTERLIEYRLSYDSLEGGQARQAHIHIAQRAVNGAIAAWLCDTAAIPAPAGVDVPTCPPTAGTVEGTIRPADVRTIDTQGLHPDTSPPALSATDTPDERFDDLVRAIRAGVAYSNVHTVSSPGGEIRGQLGDNGNHGDNDSDD